MDFRGNRGDTQGQPYDNERGRPLSMLIRRATGRYKETKFYRVGKESDLPILPLVSEGQHNLGRGKGQYFYHVSEEVKGRRLHERAGNPRAVRELQRKLYQKAKQEQTAKATGRR